MKILSSELRTAYDVRSTEKVPRFADSSTCPPETGAGPAGAGLGRAQKRGVSGVGRDGQRAGEPGSDPCRADETNAARPPGEGAPAQVGVKLPITDDAPLRADRDQPTP